MTFKQLPQAGFTILETMVAIAILLIAVTGPLSTIGSALGQIYMTRDQMIAINLAQEGVEAVRQVRDSKLIQGWVNNASPFSTIPAGGYYLNSSRTLMGCSASDCTSEAPIHKTQGVDVSYYQGALGAGVATNFTRVITISDMVNSTEKKVISMVKWRTSGGAFKDVVVTEYLFAVNEAVPVPAP